MSIYKCVACGREAEAEKERSCPECGCKMFETPYDRAEKLRSEIIDYVVKAADSKIDTSEIFAEARQEEHERFPRLGQIRQYAESAEKTEIFLVRLQKSIQNIYTHIHTPFEKTYKADLKSVKDSSDEIARQVDEIAEALGLEQRAKDFSCDVPVLHHSEEPDEVLLPFANEILGLCETLREKIRVFIRRNGIYNNDYQYYHEEPDAKPAGKKAKEKKSAEEVLLGVVQRLRAAVEKRYYVDILESGSEQLHEMLDVLWDSLRTLLRAHLFVKTDRYDFGGETGLDGKTFYQKLGDCLSARFLPVKEVVEDPGFLADKTEEELFECFCDVVMQGGTEFLDRLRLRGMRVRDSEKQLNEMIGLEPVKESIRKLKAYAISNKDRKDFNLHMAFCGNPGTGKTQVARLIAGILHEIGVLPSDHVVETDRAGLVAGYVGQTAIKTEEVIEEAMGGVLFIDEAYALAPDDFKGDYGYEAIATLIKAMEDNRGEFCVILAGYRGPIEKLIASNPGFRSRIAFILDFPNYNRAELEQIANLMLTEREYTISPEALAEVLDITDYKRKEPDFANARELRNILEQVIICQNIRCVDASQREIELMDVRKYVHDAGLRLPVKQENRQILTAEEELDALIGLDAVKRMVRKIKASAKRSKDDPDFSMHMCFLGNPGTGKTEVARLISRILFEAGALPEAKLTETDANGLIGRYVGETAPKTLEKINDAMGGVLFIDEAYVLSGGGPDASASYGDEAIAVLLREMENRRGKFCVILAGYRENMDTMLSSNPGMKSRIQFRLNFPDYTREELTLIAQHFLEKKGYQIDSDALELVMDITEHFRGEKDFANARTVRNILEQVIMNQNLRTEDSPDRLIIRSDAEDYLRDENIDFHAPAHGSIGFHQ